MESYKVLVTRTAPPNFCIECSGDVRSKCSNAEIHYLSSFPMQEFLYKEEFCDKIIRYPYKFFSLNLYTLKLIMTVKRNKYDRVIVIWNNPFGDKTHNINIIGKLIGGHKTEIYSEKRFSLCTYSLISHYILRDFLNYFYDNGRWIWFPVLWVWFRISLLLHKK